MLLSLGLTTGAYASSLNLSGAYQRFDYCPIENPEIRHCVYSVTQGGYFILGKKTVPIVHPVTLQGAYGRQLQPYAQTLEGTLWYLTSHLYPPSGTTFLSKTPQPVPGGLLGLVPPSSSPPAIRALTAFYSEHNASTVNSTLEIAGTDGPGAEAYLSEFALSLEFSQPEGASIQLPVKVHLENPFLGSSCYIGTDSSPIRLPLFTGATSPPPPARPIHGAPGPLIGEEEDEVVNLVNTTLVDNSFAAPGATGCGGALAPIVDQLIDATTGLPSPAGRNTAVLSPVQNVIASATAVRDKANGE